MKEKVRINTTKAGQCFFQKARGHFGSWIGVGVGRGVLRADPSAVELFVVGVVRTSQRLRALTFTTHRDCLGKSHHRVIIIK